MGKSTSLTRKGQVTIPKEVRDELGLKPSGQVEVWVENGEARLRTTRHLPLRKVAGSIRAPALSLEAAIARAKAECAEERARKLLHELSPS